VLGGGQTSKAEADVSLHREPWKDAALLEDEDSAWVRRADRLAVDPYFAAGRVHKAADDVERLSTIPSKTFPGPGRRLVR